MKANKISKLLKNGIIFIATILIWYLSIGYLHNSIHLLFMVTLGHWAWTTNLDILYRQGIDPLSMLEHVPGYQVSNSYSIAIFMSILCCLFGWLNGIVGEMISPLCFIILGLFWIHPFKLFKAERYTLLSTMYKSIVITRVDLSQVILCDIFTSFSRIICQMILENFWFAMPANKITYHANRGKLGTRMDIIVPLLVAIPYLLRLRQCLWEASDTKDVPSKRVHYANAIKYLTSLPVIFTGHFMTEWEIASKDVDYRDHEWNHGIVFWIWVAVLCCNTAYSLYWDICMDWQLCGRFAIVPKPASQNGILRPVLQFKKPYIYYLAMVMNSILRFAWLLRLWYLGTEPTIALDVTLAIAEIFRRWVWVFFRLEREWVINIPSPIIYEQVNTD